MKVMKVRKGMLMISMIAGFVLACMMLPMTAFGAESYGVWVGDTEVTSETLSGNGWKFAVDEQATAESPMKGTLTLTDANITASTEEHDGYSGGYNIYAKDMDLTIKFTGTNKVGNASDPTGYGIYTYGGDLTIDGEGSLMVAGKYNAIESDFDLNIRNGYVSADSVEEQPIYCKGNITIDGGKVEAVSPESGREAIYATNGAFIVNAGEVIATSAQMTYPTIHSASGIEINGGIVSATNSGEGSEAAGLYTTGDISIANATVNAVTIEGEAIYAKGGSISMEESDVTAIAPDMATAICADKTVSISGGTVKALSTEENGEDAIVSENSNINITDGADVTVDAAAYGINADEDLVIADSTVHGTTNDDYVLYANNINITGSTVTAEGKADEAIYARNQLSIEDSEIDAKAGKYSAIFGFNTIIKGSNVKAVSATKNGPAFEGESITIERGEGDLKTRVEAETVEGDFAFEFTKALTLGKWVYVITPEGGAAGTYTDEDGDNTETILLDGIPATHVIIEEGERTTRDITFNANGHGTAPEPQEVAVGGNVTEPEALTEDGWLFGGWYKEAECENKYVFTEAVADDMTLFAKWTKLYTVTFKDAAGKEISSAEYAEGTPASEIELPEAPEKEPTDTHVYEFSGWTPEIADVTADAEYTPEFAEYDKYQLKVEQIHAGDNAVSAADVEEADGKEIEIGTTGWVQTEKDLAAQKAYFAGDKTSKFDQVTGEFMASITYYSVAIVKFKDGPADPARVAIAATDLVKQAGEAVVNKETNEVIVPFQVDIPAITVTAEFGQGHESYAAKVAQKLENVVYTVSGNSITYKAEKGTDRWLYVLAPIRHAMYDQASEEIHDSNERLAIGKGVPFNLKPLSEYKDYEAWYVDVQAINDHGAQDTDLTVYAQWEKPTGITLKITKPLCGTKITVDEETYEQTPLPEIAVTSGKAYIDKEEPLTRWVEDNGYMPFAGTMEGGKTYTAMVMPTPEMGYYVDMKDITVVNGTLVEDGSGDAPEADGRPIAIEVEAVHEYGAWKVTKAAGRDTEGTMARICSGNSSHKLTKVIAPTGRIFATLKTKGKTALKLSWNKVKDASYYEVWFSKCGEKDSISLKKYKTVKASGKLAVTIKKLKKKSSYKAVVKAYAKKSGKKVYLQSSPEVHIFAGGANKKCTNVKKLKLSKTKATVKAGKTHKIKAKLVKLKKNKKLMPAGHAKKLRYYSSNKNVAAVTRAGVVKAKKAGTAKIYVISVNGLRKTVKITVK